MDNRLTKAEIGWVLYDWANSAFAVVVIAGFFPIYFKRFLGTTISDAMSTFWLGAGNSISAGLLAVSAPLLGALADRRGHAKRWLAAWALVGIIATVALSLPERGGWQWGVVLFVIALLGFGAANLFYDTLLRSVTSPQSGHRISALGYALGYIGGGLLFLGCVLAVRSPHLLNAPDEFAVMRRVFRWVGAWWALFSIPIVVWASRAPATAVRGASTARLGGRLATIWRDIRHTFRDLKQHRAATLFLFAYWCYIDGVHTIIRMAVDFGAALGFSSTVLVTALLMVQFISFPTTLLYYRLGKRIGMLPAIAVGVIGYIGISLLAMFLLSRPIHFFLLAMLVALFQGGIQALSRSMFSTLIPAGQAGRYFGFYNMLGRFAAILGPLLLGGVVLLTDNYRLSVVPILLLLVAGLLLLRRVPHARSSCNDAELSAKYRR